MESEIEEERIGVCKFPFTAEEETEMSMKKGEVMVIVEEVGDGWSFCYMFGNPDINGYVPTAYLDVSIGKVGDNHGGNDLIQSENNEESTAPTQTPTKKSPSDSGNTETKEVVKMNIDYSSILQKIKEASELKKNITINTKDVVTDHYGGEKEFLMEWFDRQGIEYRSEWSIAVSTQMENQFIAFHELGFHEPFIVIKILEFLEKKIEVINEKTSLLDEVHSVEGFGRFNFDDRREVWWLFPTLYLDFSKLRDPDFPFIIVDFCNLKNFYFYGLDLVRMKTKQKLEKFKILTLPILRAFSSQLKNKQSNLLKKLTFRRTTIDQKNHGILLDVPLPRLESLSILNCVIPEEQETVLLKDLTSLKKLKMVYTKVNHRFFTENEFPSLVELDISACAKLFHQNSLKSLPCTLRVLKINWDRARPRFDDSVLSYFKVLEVLKLRRFEEQVLDPQKWGEKPRLKRFAVRWSPLKTLPVFHQGGGGFGVSMEYVSVNLKHHYITRIEKDIWDIQDRKPKKIHCRILKLTFHSISEKFYNPDYISILDSNFHLESIVVFDLQRLFKRDDESWPQSDTKLIASHNKLLKLPNLKTLRLCWQSKLPLFLDFESFSLESLQIGDVEQTVLMFSHSSTLKHLCLGFGNIEDYVFQNCDFVQLQSLEVKDSYKLTGKGWNSTIPSTLEVLRVSKKSCTSFIQFGDGLFQEHEFPKLRRLHLSGLDLVQGNCWRGFHQDVEVDIIKCPNFLSLKLSPFSDSKLSIESLISKKDVFDEHLFLSCLSYSEKILVFSGNGSKTKDEDTYTPSTTNNQKVRCSFDFRNMLFSYSCDTRVEVKNPAYKCVINKRINCDDKPMEVFRISEGVYFIRSDIEVADYFHSVSRPETKSEMKIEFPFMFTLRQEENGSSDGSDRSIKYNFKLETSFAKHWVVLEWEKKE